jgi:chemotaxis protein methyltransferase CheR
MRIELAPYNSLIKERCGLLIEGSREELLIRALSARSAALGIEPARYYARLLGSEAEFQELVNLLTINETYFFREPEQIRLVVDTLAPRLLAARGNAVPLRILSAGCASGEEPYSLVMALLDRYGEQAGSLFSVIAADIDSLVLAKAREACYSAFSFRNMPEALRNRYFEPTPAGNVLRAQVQKQVGFHQVNFLASPFPPALSGCDIIFFRNVSIYFDQPTRITIQRNLASLLREDGVLFCGTSETLANDLGILSLVQESGLFYFVKKGVGQPGAKRADTPGARRTPSSRPPDPPRPDPLPAPRSARSRAGDLPGTAPLPATSRPFANAAQAEAPGLRGEIAAARRLLGERLHEAALARLEAGLRLAPDDAEAGILRAHVLLQLKDFAGAAAQAERVLARDAWSVDACLLLGLAAKWRQQPEEAIRRFKQAAYTQPGCWPAQYYLADLYRARGADGLARRAYRVVLQQLDAAPDDHGLKSLPLDLPVGEIRFLCRHQLATLPMDAATTGPR